MTNDQYSLRQQYNKESNVYRVVLIRGSVDDPEFQVHEVLESEDLQSAVDHMFDIRTETKEYYIDSTIYVE